MAVHTELANQSVFSKNRSFNILLFIFAVLSIIGIVCWGIQLSKGLQMTNLSVVNMWGLYITFFTIFTGVAAGSLFFASLPYLFHLNEFKPYCRIAAYTGAVSSIVAASLFIIVDIGNPERAWLFITSGNFTSPMFWDFLMLLLYMVTSVIFTRQLILVHEGKKDEKALKPIAVVAFVAGIMVVVTSFVFTFQIARPLWNTPAQPFSFLVAAFAAALAVFILVAFTLKKSGYLSMKTNLLAKIGKVIALLLSIEFILVSVEALIGLYPGEGEEFHAFTWLVTGDGAVGFWLSVVALIGAIVLLSKKVKTEKGGSLIAGAILGLAAIFLVKSNLLQSELFNPLLSLPGPEMYGGMTGPYYPSLLEIGVSLGIISLGALLFMLGLRWLNLGEKMLKHK